MNWPNLDAIEARAKAADQGEWRVSGAGYLFTRGGGTRHVLLRQPMDAGDKADFEYVISMQPQVALALVAELRAIHEAAAKLSPIVADLAYWAGNHGDPDGEVARLRIQAEALIRQIGGAP